MCIFLPDPSPPTIPELIHLSLADRNVNLLQEVGTKYKSFGTLLLEDSTGSKMAAIEHALGRNIEDINYRVFQDWIGGNGKMPVSWDSLVSVLQDVKMESLAEAVQEVKCSKLRRVEDRRSTALMKTFK